MNTYLFNVTDTVNGEANCCWFRRYKVSATSMRGAVRKVNKEEGFPRLRLVMTGELYRWDVPNACICIFGQEWDEYDEQRNYKDLT